MTSRPPLDVLGIGFGPSNLALAIALREQPAPDHGQARLRYGFVEKQDTFGWHRGMLIAGATMQVAFMKDLVTMRDPTSRFSFLAYLHAKGRLADFINHKTMYPTRVEFHDYLEWAAEAFRDVVAYGQETVTVEPVVVNGRVVQLDVHLRETGTGARSVRRTRNLVVASGLQPRMPEGVERADDIWHSAELLDRVGGLDPARPWTFAVLGAGQSAAEVVEFLHRHFQKATVVSVFARYGYSPADDTPFVNGIFDPRAVDTFFHAPAHVKRMLLDYHGNTNYSAVDVDLIQELYRRVYEERVTGVPRLRIVNTSRVVGVDRAGGGLRVMVEALPTGEVTELRPDALVCATGYRPPSASALLGGFLAYCKTDDRGEVLTDRGYRVVTTGETDCAVYLQGATEHTHGISSSLLSNTAVRAGEIAAALAAARPPTESANRRAAMMAGSA